LVEEAIAALGCRARENNNNNNNNINNNNVIKQSQNFMSVVYGGCTSAINCPLKTKRDSRNASSIQTSKGEQLVLGQ
jgi:hypothetical protein